jgi:hypothetical protein
MEPSIYFFTNPAEVNVATYFTLSYRWGPNPVKTLLSNLDEFKGAIPFNSLPKVIQDALQITRQIGGRYLWVDALCIVLDSEAEWQSEIRSMDQIYRSSLLTITADVESLDSSEGFFSARTKRTGKDKELERPSGILDSKGWILQEQLLSTRVLTYS